MDYGSRKVYYCFRKLYENSAKLNSMIHFAISHCIDSSRTSSRRDAWVFLLRTVLTVKKSTVDDIALVPRRDEI